MTMDYLISLEIAAIGGYLVWLGWKLHSFARDFKFPDFPVIYPQMPSAKEIVTGVAMPDTVEIIKVLEDGSVAKIRDEHIGHSDIEVVWRTPDLGIRHPDGHIQMTKDEACN